MLQYLVIILIATLTLQSHSEEKYFLNPPLPPTAYKHQFYTAQFRVVGLDNPEFQFKTLPKPLKGFFNGTISGMPQDTGSFPVVISYSSGNISQTKEVVFRVMDPLPPSQSTPITPMVDKTEFIVIQNYERLTFIEGNYINMQF